MKKMKKYENETVIVEANLIAKQKLSTMEASILLGVPQTTIVWHIHNVLKDLDVDLYNEAISVLLSRKKGGRKPGKKQIESTPQIVEEQTTIHGKEEILVECKVKVKIKLSTKDKKFFKEYIKSIKQ